MDSLLKFFIRDWGKEVFVKPERDNELWLLRIMPGSKRRVIITYTNETYPPWMKSTTFQEDPTKIPIECEKRKDLLIIYDETRFCTGQISYVKYRIYEIDNPLFDPEKIFPEINDFLRRRPRWKEQI